ncbi:acyl-CoA synthetase (AMP-forming)/AMP-acid ligase II [Dysgonomonadaceae bacterium PH5-43]|nr:acyl-CoA synthetase (AMP-forming)/AMP-acid ligase II [Dysgonomonadaceae bacterium PH5-43]
MGPKLKEYIFFVCGILLVLSAVLYSMSWEFIPYVYAVAGAGVAVVFLSSPYNGDNKRLKRLNVQQAIAAILLPLSSYFMFKDMNEWIVCLLVSGILQSYVVFVQDYEEKKNNKEDKEK